MTKSLIPVGLLLIAAALIGGFLLARPPSGTGFTMVRWENPESSGTPSRRAIVSEPYVREGPTAHPFSVEWRGWFTISEQEVLKLFVEADDPVTLALDGQLVIDEERPQPRHFSESKELTLPPGVHDVTLHLSERGGGQFLRLFYQRMDGPHGWAQLPWQVERTWPSRAQAEQAPRPLAPLARAWLFAGMLLLAIVGGAILLRARARRAGRPLSERRDLLIASGLGLMAFGIRGLRVDRADIYWDEEFYLRSGFHYVRNLLLGDLSVESFRWNLMHPPISKWLYGIADLCGGPLAAKLMAAAFYALTCVFIYLIGRRYASRLVGASAAWLVAWTPYLLGHGASVGLEAAVVFFMALAAWLLLLACERRSFALHFGWAFAAMMGVGSKAIAVWFAPVALGVCLASFLSGSRRLRPYLGAFVGAAVGLGLIYLASPYLWGDTVGRIQGIMRYWEGSHPSEWIAGSLRQPPVWYYAFAFLIQNPTGLLLFGAIGLVFALRRRTLLDWLLVAWLVFPFGQSLSTMRQDAARYVISAFPPLAFLGALGVDALFRRIRRPEWARWGQLALCGYVAALGFWMMPHGIDYAAEWAGGPAGVIEKRWLEFPFWGEGNRELADAINELVPPGGEVRLQLEPHEDFPHLRSDIRVTEAEGAQYLAMNFFQYPAKPTGYRILRKVMAGNGWIGALYERE